MQVFKLNQVTKFNLLEMMKKSFSFQKKFQVVIFFFGVEFQLINLMISFFLP